MRQFQVPQFIMVEDKVIGPFTIKQFVFIGSGALLIVFLRTIFEGFVLYALAALISAVAVSLAFLKINDQAMPIVIKNSVFYFLRPKLYIWKKSEQSGSREKNSVQNTRAPEVTIGSMPRISVSKLSDLAWSLDLKKEDAAQ